MSTRTGDPGVQGRPKTLVEAKAWMHERLVSRVHPMNNVEPRQGGAVIERLQGLDGDSWASAWAEAGLRAQDQAEIAAAGGDADAAATLFLEASGYYFMGRFPCPNHPAKLRCATLERETYLKAAARWPCPVERTVIPFDGRAGEGREIVVYVRRPIGVARPSVVVMWGGVDAWKEQMTSASDAFIARGVATIAMDNAGTGESPVKGVADAERQFVGVMDWAAVQGDFTAAKTGLLGRSFGGYWAGKLAHVARDKVAGAVNWGGGAHYMFQPAWVEASRFPDSYLMELVETRSRMLGVSNDAGYIDAFAKLSLLDQGVLDLPCAPLLLVNGKQDRQCPIEDLYLQLDHGSPKAVRLFPGGHMGTTPRTQPIIVDWLCEQLDAWKPVQ